MIRVFILILTFCISLDSKAISTCELPFLRGTEDYKSFSVFEYFKKRKKKNKYKSNMSKLQTSFKKETDFYRRVDILEEQYVLAYENYRFRYDKLSLKYLFKSPQERKVLIASELREEFEKEINEMTLSLFELFTQKKIPVDLLVQSKPDASPIFYLSFKNAEGTSEMYVKQLSRLKEKFNLRTITFNLSDTIQTGMAGFSLSSSRRIDLGFLGAKALLIENDLGFIARHELKHAGFKRARDIKKHSIYNVNYRALGDVKLSKKSNIYTNYMTAEEVYNFANNPFWNAKSFQKISNRVDYVERLEEISKHMRYTREITAQTESLAGEFIDLARKIKLDKSIKNYKLDFFLDIDFGLKSEDHIFKLRRVGLTNLDAKKKMEFFIQGKFDDEMRRIKTHYFKAYNEVFKDIVERPNPADMAYLISKVEAKAYMASEVEVNRILDHIIKNQQTLSKVSSSLNAKNSSVLQEVDDLIADFSERKIIDENFIQNPEVQKSLKTIFAKFRNLGVSVRENYKGFLGR